MLKYHVKIDQSSGSEWIETDLTGKQLLATALLNKGTAFTYEERALLKLLGKLPHRVETLAEQVKRATTQYRRYSSNLQKYIYLNNLHDKNEILFYKLLLEDLAEILPIIYTPGVSAAVKEFSNEFRQPRGLYLSYPDRDKMAEIMDNRTHADIDLIVVTDGERILGIGDQGIGGMDIPIAKLIIYSLCGVNPYKTLPIMLDVGTNNPDLLQDPLYLGWRQQRITRQEYDQFIEQFVTTIQQKFPQAMLHWEDFAQQNARRILETYRTTHCMFNDDMQGTGVVSLAALLAAIHATGVPLNEHRVIIYGAGTAGIGIADQLYDAMVRSQIAPEQARQQFWLIDRPGLLFADLPQLTAFQQPFARPSAERADFAAQADLYEVVKKVKPTILIGCSTVRNAFNEAILQLMGTQVQQPIIFALSNPPENCEADPQTILQCTQGRALIATGSPFDPITYDNKTYHITQCNNALSFPGIGIGVIATKSTQVTDNMLWAAAQAIAEQAPVLKDRTLPLLPIMSNIPEVAIKVALAVAKQAIADGVATVTPELTEEGFAKQNIWRPFYRPIKLREG